jgi:hypothetical protein
MRGLQASTTDEEEEQILSGLQKKTKKITRKIHVPGRPRLARSQARRLSSAKQPLRCSDAASLRPERRRRLAAQRRAVRTPACRCLDAAATAPLFQIKMRGSERNEREREKARGCFDVIGSRWAVCTYSVCILNVRLSSKRPQ